MTTRASPFANSAPRGAGRALRTRAPARRGAACFRPWRVARAPLSTPPEIPFRPCRRRRPDGCRRPRARVAGPGSRLQRPQSRVPVQVGVLTRRPSLWLRGALVEFERRILARSLETWLPTRAEMDQALELVPTPMYATCRTSSTCERSPVSPSLEAPPILFVADFSYEPNQTRRGLLVEDVMPRLWNRVPGARLTLVGRSLTSRCRRTRESRRSASSTS